jgi:ketosteroid isomerase-like protein
MKGIFWAFLSSLWLLGCNTISNNSQDNIMNNQESLKAANDRLYEALNVMFTGDVEPINNVWSHSNDITYMGPFGGSLEGWDAVGTEFATVASLKIGGKITPANLIVRAGESEGYTICTELGENLDKDGNPVPVSHRATNIFRKEVGEWKLVHHHTDISNQLQESTGISD